MPRKKKKARKQSYIKDSDVIRVDIQKDMYNRSNEFRSEIFVVKQLSDLNRNSRNEVSFVYSDPVYAPINAVDPITGFPISELNMIATISDFQQNRDFIDLPSIAGTVTTKGKAWTDRTRDELIDIFSVKGTTTDVVENSQTLVYYDYFSGPFSLYEPWTGSAEQLNSRQTLENAYASIGPGGRAYLRLKKGYFRGEDTDLDASGESGTLLLLRDAENLPYTLWLSSVWQPVDRQINFV